MLLSIILVEIQDSLLDGDRWCLHFLFVRVEGVWMGDGEVR